MYVYDEYDQRIIEDRVKQFRDQTRRYLAGELSEEEFRPLRLQNGLYIQRFAPMLRVAVPYGQLTSRQMRNDGQDRPRLRQGLCPHQYPAERAVQLAGAWKTFRTSSLNWRPCRCTRSRPAATACATSPPTSLPVSPPTKLIDPRPWCEIVRQWTTFHPEFAYLPRKFKIAVNGSTSRPRRHRSPRHRPGAGAQRRRRTGLPRAGRRRPGPYAGGGRIHQ